MPENNQRRDKDTPLRQDVRMLGNALGQAIQRHGGEHVFDMVEHLRKHCKQLRDCTERLSQVSQVESEQLQSEITTLSQEIAQTVNSCDLDTAIDVIRAFHHLLSPRQYS